MEERKKTMGLEQYAEKKQREFEANLKNEERRKREAERANE